MYSTYDYTSYGLDKWNDNDKSLIRTRDIAQLHIDDLISKNLSHKKREPVVIDGEPVVETLKQRLIREKTELEIALQQLATQLARRTAQVEHLERYPEDDPCVDGDVIQFEKKFPNGKQLYSYVAHKAAGLWYVTGDRSPQGITWTTLINWMGLGVSEVYRIGGKGGRRKIIG